MRHDAAICGLSTKNGKSTEKMAWPVFSNLFQQVLEVKILEIIASFSRSPPSAIYKQSLMLIKCNQKMHKCIFYIRVF